MTEYIDVFTQLPQESSYFIVDTSKSTVPLLRSNPSAVPFFSAGGKKTLQKGDNFTILSAGFIFPESFCLSSAPANAHQTSLALNISLSDTIGGADYYLSNFGLSGIQLPLENYETPIGIFADMFNIGGPVFPFRLLNFYLKGTLRGIDEFYSSPNIYDNTAGTPADPLPGDTWTALVSAHTWVAGDIYTWNGTAWDNVTGTPRVYPQVSMIGVPAAFNGKKVRVTTFIKILHNFPVV